MPSSGIAPWRSPAPGRPQVPLPPARMPLLRNGRALKRWRYVGCFGPDVMLCAAIARIGVVPVSWWAVWDRRARTLVEHTRRGRPCVHFDGPSVRVDDGPVSVDLTVEGGSAVEIVSPHGGEYIWTRKVGGVRVRGSVTVAERRHEIDARGLIDESAGYFARRTAWLWSAGVGVAESGQPVAWNLVQGVHDDPAVSERTVWLGDEPHHVEAQPFAPGLAGVGGLVFEAEATRAHSESLLVLASSYEQPFGTFSGSLPIAGPLREAYGTFSGSLPIAGPLREAYGVMERHDVTW